MGITPTPWFYVVAEARVVKDITSDLVWPIVHNRNME